MYTVRSSEKLRKSGADGETKALLYLMSFMPDSDEIHYFVVDFFNDLTGMDRFSSKLWDVQSKAQKDNSPKALGRELVTLFKNYISDIDFTHYILFFGGITSRNLINSSLTSFGIENFTQQAKDKIKSGLIDECSKKDYIDESSFDDSDISCFLQKVNFVIDSHSPAEYVKEIIRNHPALIPDDNALIAIFNEIRNKQSEKKNTLVEGITINATDEVLNYCRHLKSSEIKLLTLQRIINSDPVGQSVPVCFIPIYNKWVPENQKAMLEECKQSLCCALFNNNAADSFWALFENIYICISNNPDWEVEQIYQALDNGLKKSSPNFDVLSLKYFIAIVKDGLKK